MATELQPSAKPAVPHYETAVEQQFDRARRRFVGLDLGASLLILCALVVGYGLVAGLADRTWQLPVTLRLGAWCVFLVGLLAFAGCALNRLALRRVNPLFLARKLESTLPDAKNSIINWLDLRAEPLAPVIRNSLGRRAAKDLAQADPEQALSARPLGWLGGLAGLLVLLQLGWLAASPTQALSLLRRAFLPFESNSIATRTALILVKPEGGNASVPVNQPVVIRVRASGHVPALNQPDSLKLHFHYNANEVFEQRPLTQDADGTWTTVVLADQVRSGFYYKITGGDARLPEDGEYRVVVKASPQVQRFEVTHRYRPYLHLPDKKIVHEQNVRPSITELRGTQTTLLVRTNRHLKHALLEVKTAGGKKELLGEAVPGHPDSWSFTWILEQSGEFRVHFQSTDGEDYVDRQPCKFEVVLDNAPHVTMTEPARDITLPANGTLLVKGFATDDLGVQSLQLRLKLLKAPTMPELLPKAYRPEVSFQLSNGKYPRRIDYSDIVALDTLKSVQGAPFPLAPGMELEYWIEARDNCDYPDQRGQLGESKHFKLTIGDPETNDSKVKQDRKAAQQQQEGHNKQQDQSLADQKLQADAEKQAQQGNAGQQPQDQQNKQELEKDKSKVADAINKQTEEANSKGESKADENNKEGSKKEGPENGDAGAGAGKSNPPDSKDSTAQDKGAGNQDKGEDNKPGDAKDKESPKPDPAGAGKDNGGAGPDQQPPGGAKGDDKKDGQQKDGAQSSAKKEGPDQNKDNAGESKGGDGGKADKSESKGDGQPNAAKEQKPGGDAKASNSTEKSWEKSTTGSTEQPAAKGEGEGAGKEAADAKNGPPADVAPQAGNGKRGDRKNANLDDVAELKRDLDDPARQGDAENGLEKIVEQAADPRVKDAADNALKEQKKQAGKGKTGDPAGNAADTKGQGQGGQKGQDDAGSGAAKAATPPAQGDAEAGKQKESEGAGSAGAGAAKKPGAGTPGGGQASGGRQDDAAEPNPVDAIAASKAGELQLENVKKQIDKLRNDLNKDVLKRLGWSEAQREDFLRKMMADALLRQQQQNAAGAEKLPAAGSLPPLLPLGGPQVIQGTGNPPPPPEIAPPPPELREAQKVFQNK